jgi:hypothetical protein
MPFATAMKMKELHWAAKAQSAKQLPQGAFFENSRATCDAASIYGPHFRCRLQLNSWCPGRDLNPHSPCGEKDFKSFASADFATRAALENDHYARAQRTSRPLRN